MSYKVRQPSSPVINVVLGQVATHELNRGPRYHNLCYALTITKTGATAGAAFQPKIGDVLSLITILVNDAERRVHTAEELDAVQNRWSPNLAIAKFDQIGNDLKTAAADVVVGANTTRTTTFLVTVNFAEPSRSTFSDREKFAWPTAWASGRTAKIQIKLAIAAAAGCASPIVTCKESVDYQLGPVDPTSKKDSMPITMWYRQEETYGGLTPVIRKWSFKGLVQQMSIFSQTGDEVQNAKLKLGTGVIFDDVKASVDKLQDENNWNPAGKADARFDFAADYSDNPGDAVLYDGTSVYELALTLKNSAAANKTLVILSQVYFDALA